MTKVLNTSELLENLAKEHKRNKISIGEIKNALHERGFGILFLVFSLPLIVPLPVPTGMGTALSIPLVYFSFQFMMNVDSPWLPKWLLDKEFRISTFRRIIEKTVPYLKFVEKLLKRRVLSISNSRRAEIFIGIFILLLQIPVALPFPLSNVLPAISIVIISLGMLEKDGLMILIGLIAGLFAWIVLFFIAYAVYAGANEAMKYVPEDYRDDVKELKDTYVPEIDQMGPMPLLMKKEQETEETK